MAGNKRPSRQVQNSKSTNGKDLIESLSWVASILSLLLGILVWAVPSPNSLISLLSTSSRFGLWHFLEVGLFSILVGFGLSTLAKLRYRKAVLEGKGTKSDTSKKGIFRVYAAGDWSRPYHVFYGYGLISISTILAILASILEIFQISIPRSLTFWLFLTLGFGMFIVVKESKDFFSGIQGKIFFEGSRNDIISLILFSLIAMFVFTITIIVIFAKIFLALP